MTGDCNYHPVIRFLYGWFASQSGGLSITMFWLTLKIIKKLSLIVIFFRSIPGIDVHDVSSFGQIGDCVRFVKKIMTL